MPDHATEHNVAEWSVSGLSRAIRNHLEDRFGRVRVRGELGRVMFHRNGHVYLDIKEDAAVLSGVIWRSTVPRLRNYQPTEGDEVIATGKVSAYAGSSRYQLVIDSIELAGAGSILLAIQRLREQLAEEGLFAEDRKRDIPYLPGTVGVITSPSGAVIRDIITTLHRRFPRQVVVWPAAVQGPNCPTEVTEAIRGFNDLDAQSAIPRPDVLIIARGGGSVEDLAGFSDEAVVRAIAASDIPTIAAIGHHTDTPLADLAADVRAPTPTAAAELAVPERDELMAELGAIRSRLSASHQDTLERKHLLLNTRNATLPSRDDLFAAYWQHVDQAAAELRASVREHVHRARVQLSTVSLPSLAPWLALRRQQLDEIGTALQNSGSRVHKRLSGRLQEQSGLLEALGYKATLMRGFAVIHAGSADAAPAGPRVYSRKTQIIEPAAVEIEFADGRLPAKIGPR